MGVDQTSLDRIRNATFPTARRGYDKHEVEKFLARLADWLATGAGDESRSDTVKRELERVGQRTGAILAQAEESAQQIRGEAEEEARQTITSANEEAEQARTEAAETRRAADVEAGAIQQRAEDEARKKIEAARAQAKRIVDEGAQRREDIEAVIADLVRRRDEVLADTEELSSKLTRAVTDHRPQDGQDAFDKPERLDPLDQEDAETGLVEDEPTEPRDVQDEATETRVVHDEPAASDPSEVPAEEGFERQR